MLETFDGKNSNLNFTNSDPRVNLGVFARNFKDQKRNKSIVDVDQTTLALQKNFSGNQRNQSNGVEQSALNDQFTWNFNQNIEASNPYTIPYRISRTGLYSDNVFSYADQDKNKFQGNESDKHNIYEEDEDDYNSNDRRTRNNSDTNQMSTELFANIKQMKIFQQMKDYVRTLKKNKIIQRIWFCQINSRWTQQRSLSVSILMMSICTFMILLVCWIILLVYMYRIFDDTYHPNYLENQKNQLIYSLSSVENTIQSMLHRTDHLHQVAINIFQTQQKHKNNPFYDINSESQILKGKKNYISIKEDVQPSDENNLGFVFNKVNQPLSYNFFQWAAFKNQKNYLDISSQSQQTLDDFDILSYFIKNMIGHAKLSQSFSYYCGFERDELVIYYPAGLQSVLKNMDQQEEFTFHPQKRDWYASIIKNNLQQTNQTYITLPYIDQVTQQYIMTMSTPLRDYDGNFLGVCAIDYLLDNIDTYIFQFGVGTKSKLAMIDSESDQGFVLSALEFKNYTAYEFAGLSNSEWLTIKQQTLQRYSKTQNSTNQEDKYLYFEMVKGYKIGSTAFKSKKSNQQLFIILVIESQEDFENLYDQITDEVYDNYIKPNITYMIIFVILCFCYIIYSLFMAHYITQPYRDIKRISTEIMKNQKVSNQIGSIMAYFNSLNFKHDQYIHNLVKSAMIMVQRIQQATAKKIMENQKFSHAYQCELNQYFNSQMEWREQIQLLKDYEFSRNFTSLPTDIDLQYQCDTKSSDFRDLTPFPVVNNRQDSNHKLKQKIIFDDDSPLDSDKTNLSIDQKFMNHLEQYLPNLPIP